MGAVEGAKKRNLASPATVNYLKRGSDLMRSKTKKVLMIAARQKKVRSLPKAGGECVGRPYGEIEHHPGGMLAK